MLDQLSLGEYTRRLRRRKKWSLQRVADVTGLSYSHLSRIENDSTVPNADTVAKLAEALEGDLKLMLEMADCLPRQILDRIMDREEAAARPTLQRSAGPAGDGGAGEQDGAMLSALRAAGVSEQDAASLASTFVQLLQLEPWRRRAVATLIRELQAGEDAAES